MKTEAVFTISISALFITSKSVRFFPVLRLFKNLLAGHHCVIVSRFIINYVLNSQFERAQSRTALHPVPL